MALKRKASAKEKASAKKAAKKSVKADLKTKPTAMSVSSFIDAVENETRRKDAKTLLAMMKKVTGEKPKMWGASIIGFGTYHYKYESGREGDMLAVGFSPRKANMVLYVLGSLGDDEPLLQQLGPYKNGKSCLYVNALEKVDLGVLEKIVVKSYKTTKAKWG
ncbi:DUF1801 domain-containing protein [Hyphococcus sp.]|uniref:DUF1801 domain-containing protein n=1 Tax=Hyphococcus sp. TaxID=2038636 RepID=UPI0020806C39|nr:MAG: hypothetical protein DHS20C04_21290 [Marinicaulis sp.]